MNRRKEAESTEQRRGDNGISLSLEKAGNSKACQTRMDLKNTLLSESRQSHKVGDERYLEEANWENREVEWWWPGRGWSAGV